MIIRAGQIENDEYLLYPQKIYRYKGLVSLIFFYLSKNKLTKKLIFIINILLSISQLLCICFYHNTLIIYFALYNNSSYNIYKKLNFCSYLDFWLSGHVHRKNCPMCPDKWISTVILMLTNKPDNFYNILTRHKILSDEKMLSSGRNSGIRGLNGIL